MIEDRRRLLPPIGALQCFLAAARHQSFSRAAEDVGLTQSAVSRQIATLEDWLQCPLFVRVGRRVELNEEGRTYLGQIAPALAAIRGATARILRRPSDTTLSIATLPSFGMRWLAPRLGKLTAAVPELVVDFAARVHEFDFTEEPFDAAIHHGLPTWPGVDHDLLFKERVILVMAPALAERFSVRSAADLLAVPLLMQAERRDAWARWFTQAGIPEARPPKGTSFEHFLMVAQAAVGGAGAALLPSFMIAPEIASGALVCPIDLAVETEEAYYFVYPSDRLQRPHFTRFRAWLLEEAEAGL